MNLGERIYELRNEKNLSQGELSDRLEVSRQSISKWENNMAVPDLDKLIKLCEVFEISLDELVGREKAEKSINPAPPQNVPVAPHRISAYVLLGVTILGAIITLVTVPTAIFLCIPLLISTIICFKVKKHAWYWCIWSVYLFFEAVFCIGIQMSIMHIAKIVFLIIMTILNIVCIKDIPALPKNKRMIILIISELAVLLSLGAIILMIYMNYNVSHYFINEWIYCPVYVLLTASIGVSIYHIIGFVREAKRKKLNK